MLRSTKGEDLKRILEKTNRRGEHTMRLKRALERMHGKKSGGRAFNGCWKECMARRADTKTGKITGGEG